MFQFSLRYAVLTALALGALASVTSNYCKRDTGYTYSLAANGWDKCDSNGLACCYYVNGSVVIYSHGYNNNGSYNANTHCEYIIDINADCNIVMCIQMDFSMDGGDSIKIRTMDMSIDYRGDKRPYNANLNSNSASVEFSSDSSEPPAGSNWAMGFVCIPYTDYRSVCEVCDDIADEMNAGPEGDEVVKAL